MRYLEVLVGGEMMKIGEGLGKIRPSGMRSTDGSQGKDINSLINSLLSRLV